MKSPPQQTWRPIKPEDGNVGGDDPKVMRRIFGLDGNQYPRLSISIYPNFLGVEGLKIGVNRKDAPDGWWGECNLPAELIDDAIALLVDAKSADSG